MPFVHQPSGLSQCTSQDSFSALAPTIENIRELSCFVSQTKKQIKANELA